MGKKSLEQYEINKNQMKGGEKMMKMIFRLFMVALLCMAFAGPASAAILNSKHDFSSDSSETIYRLDNETRMCVFCHTPHNAVENVPLWNRTSNSAGYLLYTSSATLSSATKASEVNKDHISYKCLTCHDGTVSIGGGAVNGNITTGATNDKITAGNTLIGPNLTNDHPIGFDFDAVRNGSGGGQTDLLIRSVAYATSRGVRFYNAGVSKTNQMECASCHDVHGQAAPGTKFLRTSNNGSALCLTCHEK